MKTRLAPYPFDYIIGSIHYVNGFPVDENAVNWERLTVDERNDVWREYWRLQQLLAESGLCDIIAHLDLPKKFGFLPTIDLSEEIATTLDAIAKTGLTIELNTAGWHKPVHEQYPSETILRQAQQRGIPLTITADAHVAAHLTQSFSAARSLALLCGLINAAYPELKLPENPNIAEPNGTVYAIPVRAFWEGLFVNKDLFEQNGLELPTDWAKLETAIAKFNEVGIVPIAVSFADVPHYITEFSIIASGTPEQHMARPANIGEVPQSWKDGMALLNTLYKLGAFAKDANATTEAVTSQMFRDKKAAMQLDGSWFANGIAEGSWETTTVMPFPAYAKDADPTAFIGGVSMGFYLSRKAWDDPAKRDAAVSLLAYLATGDNAQRLGGFSFGGGLLAD